MLRGRNDVYVPENRERTIELAHEILSAMILETLAAQKTASDVHNVASALRKAIEKAPYIRSQVLQGKVGSVEFE